MSRSFNVAPIHRNTFKTTHKKLKKTQHRAFSRRQEQSENNVRDLVITNAKRDESPVRFKNLTDDELNSLV